MWIKIIRYLRDSATGFGPIGWICALFKPAV